MSLTIELTSWTAEQEELLRGVSADDRVWLSLFGCEDHDVAHAACNMLYVGAFWFRLTTKPDAMCMEVWTGPREAALKQAPVGRPALHPSNDPTFKAPTSPPDWTHTTYARDGGSTVGLRLAIACIQFVESYRVSTPAA